MFSAKTILVLLPGILAVPAPLKAEERMALSFNPTFLSQRTDEEKTRLTRFLNEIQIHLPDSLKKVIPSPIPIEFIQMDTYSRIQIPACFDSESQIPETETTTPSPHTERHLVAQMTPSALKLHVGFLFEILAGEENARTYPCGHKNLYRFALATVLHELAHYYDSLNLPAREDPGEKVERAACGKKRLLKIRGNLSPQDEAKYPSDLRCEYLFKIKKSVSDRAPYRDLTGWKLGLDGLFNKNKIRQRSPNPYEFHSPEESFAVNFEYFLLDPEMQCRRPSLFRFFEKTFHHTPFVKTACTPNLTLQSLTSKKPVSLDPSRIYEVHYLLAASGKGIKSRWGHGMLRLVVCAPERAEVGPDCLKDIQHHLILSFRADVDGVTLNPIKGLFGDYPSMVFVMPMLEVITEYTVGEGRDIKSIPLKISNSQKEDLILKALELFWSYQSDYCFLGNNCATEALDFLKGALQIDSLSLVCNLIAKPVRLLDILTEHGILDPSALEKPNASGRYFSPSLRKQKERTFKRLKQTPSFPEKTDYDHYLDETTPAERRDLYLKLSAPLDAPAKAKLAILFNGLEMLIKELNVEKIQKSGSKIVQEESDDKESVLSKAICQMDAANRLLFPWKLTRQGYGIAQESDLIDASETEARRLAHREARHQLSDQVVPHLQTELAERNEIKKNIEVFLEESVSSGKCPTPLTETRKENKNDTQSE